MIVRAPRGLSTPYRRIIFGLSISDIVQSFALLTGPFASPKGTTKSPWAIGNTRLCEANGFSMIFGSVAVPMYTCALCIYYLCKLKMNMTDEAFTRKVEKKLHVGIIAWNFIICTFLLVTKNINPAPSGRVCHITAYPPACRLHPEKFGECTRGKNSFLLLFLFVFCVVLLVITGIVAIMIILCCHAILRDRNFRVRRADNADVSRQQQEADSLSRIYKREMVLQAILYSGVFLVAYSLYFAHAFINMAGKWHLITPALSVTFSVLFPLGGLFNILTYTRPNVVTLHRRYSEYSWLRALWLVLKAGGEVPDDLQEQRIGDVGPLRISSEADRDLGKKEQTNSGVLSCLGANYSIGCDNGASKSFGSDEIGYRSEQDWFYAKGEGSSAMVPIQEDVEECIWISQQDDSTSTSNIGLSVPLRRENESPNLKDEFSKA